MLVGNDTSDSIVTLVIIAERRISSIASRLSRRSSARPTAEKIDTSLATQHSDVKTIVRMSATLQTNRFSGGRDQR
jgi:hypothetical protein